MKSKKLTFEIESVSFGSETNNGYLKLKLPFNFNAIKHLKAGGKLKIKIKK